ncbi:MAG: hypothetical protein ACYC9O_21260, partial [Candidatus Latescibacterota bacterium]
HFVSIGRAVASFLDVSPGRSKMAPGGRMQEFSQSECFSLVFGRIISMRQNTLKERNEYRDNNLSFFSTDSTVFYSSILYLVTGWNY